MKIYVRSDSCKHDAGSKRNNTVVSAAQQFDLHQSTRYKGQRYSIHYTEVNTSPEADPMDMFHDFCGQITEIHPYDEGDYAWASFKNGVVKYYRNGRVIEKSYYMDADDMDVENFEWCDAVISNIVEILYSLNQGVEKRMMYN